jgi:hypothetical protein
MINTIMGSPTLSQLSILNMYRDNMNFTQIFFQSLPFNPYHSLVLMNLTFKKNIFKTEFRCAITYGI